MTARKKVPVTTRALMQRINRKLAKSHEKVRASRERLFSTLGSYYRLDTGRNFIKQHHVNLEDLARELEVIEPWEEWEAE